MYLIHSYPLKFRISALLVCWSALLLASCSTDATDKSEDTASNEALEECLDQASSLTAAPSKKYLLGFHVIEAGTTSGDPASHKTWIAESDDFSNWSILPGMQGFCGSVPDLIRRDDSLFVFNAGIMRRLDRTTLNWDSTIHVTTRVSAGGAEIDYHMVDVSPFLGTDGLIHLFYLKGDVTSGDPCGCGDASTCTKTFESATEVSGSQGTEYVVDTGSRLQVDLDAADVAAGRVGACDPDIFRAPDLSYFLLVNADPISERLYTGSSLTSTFSGASGLDTSESILTADKGSVASALYDSDHSRYVWAFTKPGSQITLYSSTAANASLDGVGVATQIVNLRGASFSEIGSGYELNAPSLTVNSASGE